LNQVFNSPSNQLCALLEIYFKQRSIIEESEAHKHFDATAAQKIITVLQQQQEVLENIQQSDPIATITALDNFKVLFKLLLNLSEYESTLKVLLHHGNTISCLHRIFVRFEKFFTNHQPFKALEPENCSHTDDETNNVTPTNFLEEARLRLRWEKMFSSFLGTLNVMCANGSGKELIGQKFMRAFVRVVHSSHHEVIVRRQAAENANELLRGCNANKMILYDQQEKNEETRIQLLEQLATSLTYAGDYSLQANITEILRRVCLWSSFSNDHILKKVFSAFSHPDAYKKIAAAFSAIKGDSQFLDHIRNFVLTVNEVITKYKIGTRHVFSFKSSQIRIGKLSFIPDWIDFGKTCISMYAPYPNNAPDSEREFLALEYLNIRTMRCM
jgi:hypothetical protein